MDLTANWHFADLINVVHAISSNNQFNQDVIKAVSFEQMIMAAPG